MMTLEAIGQKLKAAREAQGLSLRQIYERTKIPINHLQSIDSGQLEDLPEPVYVAGFIKRYAECIGLDGQVLADEYRQNGHADNGNGNGRARARQALAQPVYVTPEYLKHTRIDQTPPSWKLWPFYGFAILGVIGVVSYFSNHAPSSQPDPNVLSLKDAASKMQQSAQVTAGTALTTSTGSQTAAPGPAATANNDKVVLTVSRHVWVEVKKLSSGDAIYTGNLEKGDTREFQDSQGIRVRAGDGGNLSVEFKGKIEPFGTPGKVSERTFDTHGAVASAATGQDQTANQLSSSSSASANSAANKTAKKVVHKTADASGTLGTAVHHKRHIDDGGFRSIGDGDGTRSIDVPYRYSEGRLDAN